MPSTAIRSFSYDDQSHTLFVTFVDGDLYAYLDVEPKIYSGMAEAASKGRFFAYRVRNRYRYLKLPDPTSSSADPALPPRAGAGR